jgi:heme exporter protein D
MIWQSWSDFFAMGGYALYVWGSFVVVFGVMLCELIVLRLRGKSIRKELASTGSTGSTGYMGGRS